MMLLWYRNSESGERGGELFLGGTNPTHYEGSLKYIPVEDNSYWTVKMEGWEVEFNYKSDISSYRD